MDAIVSDIHANHEALTAVLADAAGRGVARVVNLGDTLGYGPDPLACLDLARRMGVNLLGHIDYAVLHTPDAFPEGLLRNILWCQAQLDSEPDAGLRTSRADFLDSLSSSHHEAGVLFAHGTPANPRYEYLFPEDISTPRKMQRIGAAAGPLSFVGHTHVPGVFREAGPGRWDFLTPDECGPGYRVAGGKVIVNAGSVGQPRDGDPRAGYALFDGERVWFRRVEYDVEATIRKIHANPDLDDFHGDRLRDGR